MHRNADALRPGDKGMVARSAIVGDSAGNVYLEAHAVVHLDWVAANSDEAYVVVREDDTVCVKAVRGKPIKAIPVPEGTAEGVVWVDDFKFVPPSAL